MDAPPSATRRRILLWAALVSLPVGLATFFGRTRKGAPLASSSATPTFGSDTDLAEVAATTLDPSAIPADGHPVYTPLLNTEFTIEFPGEVPTKCLLVEVSPVKVLPSPKGEFTSFSLLFEAKPGYLSEGGICRVGHPKLKPMELFLSPVGRPGNGKTFLEAVFSHSA